ncbi:MAG: LamB/YcsF family protein, partial [Clostridiales bacterium]|nr:LamB/YcsF family protein [Clostridiales bacterium]
EIPIAADSICVHGDTPEAVDFVNQIRNSLKEENIVLKPLNQFI